MKGVIFGCLKEMAENQYGTEEWARALERAGLPKKTSFMSIADVDDEVIAGVMAALQGVVGRTERQVSDDFGRYWVSNYASKRYPEYFEGVHSAMDLLRQVDSVHVATASTVRNARPPRFTYESIDESTLVMEYHSARGLMSLFQGLVRGTAEHYGQEADISVVGPNKVRIAFRPRT